MGQSDLGIHTPTPLRPALLSHKIVTQGIHGLSKSCPHSQVYGSLFPLSGASAAAEALANGGWGRHGRDTVIAVRKEEV